MEYELIGESENRHQSKAKGAFSEWRCCIKMRRKVLSLFRDYFGIPLSIQFIFDSTKKYICFVMCFNQVQRLNSTFYKGL